jgi:dsDNA-specific endonuclease/ATPase MutS2
MLTNFPDNEETMSADDDSLDPPEPFDPFDPFPEPVTIPITDVFDLHTIQPRDVKRVVEEYLKEARRLGFRSVRIIHGKGIGVQREMVRAILGRTPFVTDWTDAPPEAGGFGATIVRLKVKERGRFHQNRER